MRIVQVAPFFHPHEGGVESHVRALSREMVRQGHEVTVVTARHRPDLPAEEPFEGYRIVRAPCLGVWFNTPIPRELDATLRRVGGDVAHLHFPPPLTAYVGARSVRRRHFPSCLTYHCDLYLATPIGSAITGIYRRTLLPATLDGVGRIIVHTESYARTSRALRGRRVEVIPSSVDLTRFRPDVSGEDIRRRLGLEGRRVLAFTGRLVPHKGLDALLRVLAKLPPDVSLIVIGRGPDREHLQALATRLGVAPRTHFCSSVDDDELPRYLRAADLFVFPSHNRLEGFGLAVAEALASGLPVVVADMPGVREVIQPGVEGLLAEPMIESDLEAKIMELLEDPERRRRMGIAARLRAEERFDVARIVERLVSVYRALIAAD
ncbi:MAG: glycosyltransferase family 4 protein [Thermoplasmata archaeon]|nr:glycosyltransferase family 4 protein [Thermoplasmata archaeon]